MEGLAWLIIKMAVLLAITGASFLALGWWLRGRQAAPASNSNQTESIPSAPVSRPELVEKIDFLRSSLRTTEEERDAARRELGAVREQLNAVDGELSALKQRPADAAKAPVSGATVAEAPANTSKPKAARKPRAKKAKS